MVLKAAPKLPRLRMKEELLKVSIGLEVTEHVPSGPMQQEVPKREMSAPELAKLMGEELPDPAGDGGTLTAVGPGFSPASAGAQGGLDNPLGFDDELTEEDELHTDTEVVRSVCNFLFSPFTATACVQRMELEAVKKERTQLMASLAQIKADSGKAGGELQAEDVRRLRKELELKLQKLNELKRESRRFEHQISRLSVTSRDCAVLMPGEQPTEQARVEALQDEQKVLEEELVEAEAKNRLYSLLGERTRREHMTMENKVRIAREMQDAYGEDHAVLTSHMHDMRAAKEDAERELAHTRKMCEEAKKDWHRKLKDRRKEVHDLERRQRKEAEKEATRAARTSERERADKDRQARVAAEEQAYEAQLQALQPKLEAMEASWYRLHSISGADTPEEVISYWEGLRTKEENMRELVRLAEVREAQAKQELVHLLQSRSNMFEAQNAAGEGQPDYATYDREIDDARRRMASAKEKFNKLRTVCISAQQGLRSLCVRLQSALQDAASQRAVAQLSRSSSRRLTQPSGVVTARVNDGLGNTIEDAQFFPDLPTLLAECADRLRRLLDLDRRLIAALHKVDEESEAAAAQLQDAHPQSGLTLQKGFRRRTWTGPAWMDNVTPTGHIMAPGLAMRRKKGKKKDALAKGPDLTRVLGYTGADGDVGGVVDDSDSDKEEQKPGEPGAEWDGVVDRDYIKHRAQKLAKQHDARAKQLSAGGAAPGARTAAAPAQKA
eukprot:jgi/Astpho2/3644/fgenesh1_pg.00059_%23_6_t